MSGYLARDFLLPRTFIFSCNADALVVQSTTSEAKLAFLNATAQGTLSPIYYLNADQDVFRVTKNNSNIATFYQKNETGYLSLDTIVPNQISLADQATISYSNEGFLFSQSSNVPLATLRYIPQHNEAFLDVKGSIYAEGTLFASNLTIYGDSIIIDATTSNTERVVITNLGDGPALTVTQLGEQPVAIFYDESNVALCIADGGYIGINTATPTHPLDVYGNAIISGNLGIGVTMPSVSLDILGDIQISGSILQNGSNFFDTISDWKKEPASSNIYYTSGNVGIGTTAPGKTLDIAGEIRYSQQLFSTTTTLPPFSLASTQLVTNLNANYLDGYTQTDLRTTTNLIGTLALSQGGTGSNYLQPNRLLVGGSTAIASPSELYWENATKRLGIATEAPQAALHVAGDLFLAEQLNFPNELSLSAASNAIQTQSLRLSSNLGIGIACNVPVSLYLNTTDAIKLPSGTTAQRPLSPQPGYLRYNSQTSHIEAYTSSNQWEILNRFQNNAGDTFIFPDAALHFYTSNTERLTIDHQGNIGIGTTTPLLSLDIHASDALSLPRGSSAQRPLPFPGAIRYNTSQQQFEGYTNEWVVLSGLRSPDQNTFITATNDSNLTFYTGATPRAILTPTGNLGIGTTSPQAQLHLTKDLLTKDLYTSNFTVFQNFSYSPDGISVRNHYQVNPGRSNVLLTIPTSNFSLVIPGLYAVPPENIEIHVNGIKEYDFTSSYSLQTTNTQVNISLVTPALSNQIVDILAWPTYLDPEGILLPGYVLQSFNYSYWDLTNPGSNLSYSIGNVGIGTTSLPAKFFVAGKTLLDGVVGVGTQSVTGSGLQVFGGPVRALGSVTESQLNLDRIDLGVQNNTPRMVFENSSATTSPIYELDVDNNGGVGVMRWYVPGTTLMQLRQNALQVNTNTFIGNVNTLPLNNLDVESTFSLGSAYAGVVTAPANCMIIAGNVGIGTTVPREALEVQGKSLFLGNVGIGTTVARAGIEVGDVLYVSGSVGIRTAQPQAPLHIEATTYINGNVGFGTQPTVPIDLWTTQAPSITQDAIYITTSTDNITTNDITATAITMRMTEATGPLLLSPMARIAYGNRFGTNLYGTGYENNGVLMFDTASAGTLGTRMLLAATGVGIGTTIPKAHLDVQGTTRTMDLLVPGNVGIGSTATPSVSLQVTGKTTISEAIGIGTTLPRAVMDIEGGVMVLNGNVGIGTTGRTALDVIGDSYISGRIGIATNSPLQPLHVQGDGYFSGNLGIGTTQPRAPLDIDNLTFLAGNVGINTAVPLARLDVNGDSTVKRLGVNVLPRETLDVNGNALVSGFVGINTLTPGFPLHISGASTLTVSDGKLCITKGLPTAATTDLEIQTNDSSGYSGLLIKNSGNLNPTGSIRIQSHHFNNSTSPAYAANIGLTRYNNNAVIAANTPLAALHFGGNHTTTSSANIAYASSIQAIAESTFTTSSNVATGLAFFTGSNAYQFIDSAATYPQETMRLTASRRVGIHTTLPDALLTIQASNQPLLPLALHASTAMLLPVGSNTDRPTGQLGLIRYNTEYQQFEGFGGGNSWGSLGGVRSIAGDTYILAEYTPGNNDQSLHFYTANTEHMILNPSGNLGIGTLSPSEKLHLVGNAFIDGNLTTSNLQVFGTVTFNQVASNLEQVVIINHDTGPALSVTQTGEQPIATFYDGDGSNQVVTIANTGNVGIGTTLPVYGLEVHRDVAYGRGLDIATPGCFYLQRSWDTPTTHHTIAYPDYCLGEDSAGSLQIQVKGSTKLGNISLSFLKSTTLDLFSIYYHKTSSLTTMEVSVSSASNILVQTDADCKIAWQSSGAI